jgi:hypothetical protein
VTVGGARAPSVEAAGKPFVYLVPSAAIFASTAVGPAVANRHERPHTREELSLFADAASSTRRSPSSPACAIGELNTLETTSFGSRKSSRWRRPMTTMVLNVIISAI